MGKDYPEFQWRRGYEIDIPDEGIVMVDPIYVADVYNSHDPIATYLRLNALFVVDFGGDSSDSVWFDDPYVVMPTSMHYGDSAFEPENATQIINEIGCDSGSFAFLPFRELPTDMLGAVRSTLDNGGAILMSIPAGRWTLQFEQFPAPQPSMTGLYRNIVLQRGNVG
jgi:hypothetical protein